MCLMQHVSQTLHNSSSVPWSHISELKDHLFVHTLFKK